MYICAKPDLPAIFCFYHQEAVAVGFELEYPKMGSPECYFQELPDELEPKRNKMAKFLEELGLEPTVPEGGYFMMANTSKLGECLHPLHPLR